HDFQERRGGGGPERGCPRRPHARGHRAGAPAAEPARGGGLLGGGGGGGGPPRGGPSQPPPRVGRGWAARLLVNCFMRSCTRALTCLNCGWPAPPTHSKTAVSLVVMTAPAFSRRRRACSWSRA